MILNYFDEQKIVTTRHCPECKCLLDHLETVMECFETGILTRSLDEAKEFISLPKEK